MNKRKKILLLSDDLRLPSGVGGVSKDIVLGTVDTFDWVQLGAAINHPDQGQIIDLSADAIAKSGVADASVKLYPWGGYGDATVLRELIERENIDAILHFTDPRFWTWLYQIEREIRNHYKIPILYYNIWDSGNDPDFNADAYASCDSLYAISKQTYGINVRTLTRMYNDEVELIDTNGDTIDISDVDISENMWGVNDAHTPVHIQPSDTQKRKIKVAYIPHGISTDVFKPIDDTDPSLISMRQKLFADKTSNFTLFYNSRNIRRKMVPDVIYSFNEFLMALPVEDRYNVHLLMHTTRVDVNGTDLNAVIEKLVDPQYHSQFIFSDEKLSDVDMNLLYNIADATIGIASNEGFGLSTAESLSAGTPIIVNVTGGLQDQCGFSFKGSESYLTESDYIELGSLHDIRKWKSAVSWGAWAFPIWPASVSVVGSPPTPYITDDRASNYDVIDAIREVYLTPAEIRSEIGKLGRTWLMGDGKLNIKLMTDLFKHNITDDINRFKVRDAFEVISL